MKRKVEIIGQSIPRTDAAAKVTGQAQFPGDLVLPATLHMKILFTERPHARILNIDTSRAEAYPGVVAVFTANDVPDKVEPVIVEVPDPRGPWGARGVGELPFLPLAPAILTAIHDATGNWIDEIPVTPERMWKALHDK